MGRFSLNDIATHKQATCETDKLLCTAYLTLHESKVDGLHQLCNRLPNPGELMMLWTLKQFNAFTFIPYTIGQTGTIEELIISTYSISTKTIDSLMALIDSGKIKHLHITISDSVKFRIPRVVDHLNNLLQHRSHQISLLYGWNHSKVMLMRTATGYYVVEGSGNFTENAQHEQYIFINSEDAWHFRKACIYGVHPGTD